MGIFSQIKKRLGGTTEAEASKDSKQPKEVKASKQADSKKAEKVEATKEVKTSTVQVPSHNTVIKHPDVTEKSSLLQSQGKYVFIVSDRANKTEVSKAIRSMYKVEVEKVHMLNRKGKVLTSGRAHGRRSDVKKAIVTLKKGQTISIFDTEEK